MHLLIGLVTPICISTCVHAAPTCLREAGATSEPQLSGMEEEPGGLRGERTLLL